MFRISILSIAMLAFGIEHATAQYFPSAGSYRRAEQKAMEQYNRALETGKGLRLIHSADLTLGITLPHQGTLKTEDGTLSTHPTRPDSVIKQSFTFKTKAAITASALTQFDFININRNNAFAIVWGFNANIHLDVPITDEMKIIDASYLAKLKNTRTMVAVPIGISFKTGGFASHDKADRVSFAIGATLAPTFNVLTITSSTEGLYYSRTKLYVQPYYFAELGIFGGMKWKIRAGVYPMGYQSFNKYFQPGSGNMGANEYRRIEYKSNGPLIQLTIGTMRGSHNWENSRW